MASHSGPQERSWAENVATNTKCPFYTGTTWTQMMTYLVRNGADIEEANSKPLWERARFLENQDPNQELSGAQLAENDPSPRLLKTHLPEHIMRRSVAEGKPRVIVVMRNPKDTLSSFYHWHKNMPFLPTPISWDEFFKQYQRKELFYGDLMEWLVGWWGHRHDENFLFLQFEDMKRDPRSAVAKIAQHCHVTLTSEQLDTIAAHSDFRQMRASGAIKPLLAEFGVPVTDFLRKGEVGDWKNSFTPEQSAYADDQCAKRCDPVDLKFHYE